MMAKTILATLLAAAVALIAPVQSAPADFQKANALAAQQLNAQFANIQASDSCNTTAPSCVGNDFGMCVSGTWEITTCSSGTICVALPLVNKAGTSVACDTESDAIARMQAAGADASLTGSSLGSAPSSSADASSPPDTTTAAVSSPAGSVSQSAPAPTPTDDASDDEGNCDMNSEVEAREVPSDYVIVPYLRHRRQASPAFTTSIVATPAPSSIVVPGAIIRSSLVASLPPIASDTVIGTASAAFSSSIPTPADDVPITSAIVPSAASSQTELPVVASTAIATSEPDATSTPDDGDDGILTVTNFETIFITVSAAPTPMIPISSSIPIIATSSPVDEADGATDIPSVPATALTASATLPVSTAIATSTDTADVQSSIFFSSSESIPTPTTAPSSAPSDPVTTTITAVSISTSVELLPISIFTTL